MSVTNAAGLSVTPFLRQTNASVLTVTHFYLLKRDDASLLSEVKDPSSKKVHDAVEVSRATVEPELVGLWAVAVAVLQRVVHGSNLLQAAEPSLWKLLHQGPGHLEKN